MPYAPLQSPGRAFTQSPGRQRYVWDVRGLGPYIVGQEWLHGGKRIQGLRPYYIPGPTNTLDWLHNVKRVYRRQDVQLFRGVEPNTWNIAAWDEIDQHGNMTSSGNYPANVDNTLQYSTFNPPWEYGPPHPVEVNTGDVDEFHSTQPGYFDPTPRFKIDAALSSEVNFASLLSSVVSTYNALDFDDLQFFQPLMGAFHPKRALVQPSEYRGELSMYNRPLSTGYTGTYATVTDPAIAAVSPYLDPQGVEYNTYPLATPYTAWTELASTIPGGGHVWIMAGWLYVALQDSYERITELNSDTVYRSQNSNPPDRWAILQVARARARLLTGTSASYWVGRALIYERLTDTGNELALWPTVSAISTGSITTTQAVTLNIPTGTGYDDFVELSSGGNTGLSFGAVEFAILNESQAAWSARTGMTIA